LLDVARSVPSLHRAPRGVARSDGEDAVFLAASYGLRADDWQADAICDWLARKRNGRYAAATCGLVAPRQNGKNATIEIRELYGMAELGERFLHTAHEVKTARKAFRRILSFFENERAFPELAALAVEIRKTNGQEAIVLRNGASVEFIARSSGSGRGFDGIDVLVCDEAQELTDDEQAALLPTISAATQGNPQVIFAGTPPDPNKMAAAKGEVFRRVRRDAQNGTDKALAFMEFGVPDGPLPDVDDRDLWARTNPALGGRLNIAEVERERRLMSPEKFARERLGWWGEPGALKRAFGVGKWEACRVDLEVNPEPTHVEAFGVAVSIDRAWASIGAAAHRKDRRCHLGAVKRERGTHWLLHQDPDETWHGRMVELAAERDCEFVLDGRGPASDLIKPAQEAGLRVKVASTEDVIEACAGLFDAVQVKAITHGGYDELDAAVAGAMPRSIGDRWVWGRKPSLSDISMLEAVNLAHWAADGEHDLMDSIG
jgi:hypothetical protein